MDACFFDDDVMMKMSVRVAMMGWKLGLVCLCGDEEV